MKNKKTKILFTLFISTILIFLLYQILYLEKKLEENMYNIATSDILEITHNNATFIKKLLTKSKNYVDTIQNDLMLQKKIEDQLKLLITENIKYAYILYKDKNDTFRFLIDASNPTEKAFINQKFDPDSQDWFDLYRNKKSLLIKHEILKNLSLSYIIPILKDDSVELILAIDFSVHKVKYINEVIKTSKNAIIITLLILILFLFILFIQMMSINKVKKSALIDPLTNTYNRHYLQQNQEKIKLEDYILAVIDIDFFKKVNDTYGHNIGDIILKKTAKIISDTIRISNDDIIIRYGGEEFVVLVKKTKNKKQETLKVLDRVLKNIEEYKFYISTEKYINITISIGVNTEPHQARNFLKAFELADSALYKAKKDGRNNLKLF